LFLHRNQKFKNTVVMPFFITVTLRYWWFGLWSLTPLSPYFCYIVAVSFIEGGNQNTRRKSPTCRKSLTNFITYCCIDYTSPE